PTLESKAAAFSTTRTESRGRSRRKRSAAAAPATAPPKTTTSKRASTPGSGTGGEGGSADMVKNLARGARTRAPRLAPVDRDQGPNGRSGVDDDVARPPWGVVPGPLLDLGVVLELGGELGVDGRPLRVLGLVVDDGADRALGQAEAAVDADLGQDDHELLSLIVARLDAVDRADGNAGRIALPEALLRDDVRHELTPSRRRSASRLKFAPQSIARQIAARESRRKKAAR